MAMEAKCLTKEEQTDLLWRFKKNDPTLWLNQRVFCLEYKLKQLEKTVDVLVAAHSEPTETSDGG
jgi:hypothetical protein